MVKSCLILLAVLMSSVCLAQDGNSIVYYQPLPANVYAQAPVVTMVPMVVQKEGWVNTWGIRPILTPNVVGYQYYYKPCLLRPFQPVYSCYPVYVVYPYYYR